MFAANKVSFGLFKLIRSWSIHSVALKLVSILISGQYTKTNSVSNNQQWFHYPNRIGESLSTKRKKNTLNTIPNIYSKYMKRISNKLSGSKHKKETISNMKLIRYDMIGSIDKKKWKFGWKNITAYHTTVFLFQSCILEGRIYGVWQMSSYCSSGSFHSIPQ